MLYNHQLLSLHYPKTAGKSAAVYLARNLPKPVYGHVAPGQVREIGLGPEDGVHLTPSGGHQNLRGARARLKDAGKTLQDFSKILVTVRNPYDLAVSNYAFLRRSVDANPEMRARKAFALAADHDFETWLEKNTPLDFLHFVTLPGEPLPEVQLLRFETLQADLRKVLHGLGIEETFALPHLNATARPDSLRQLSAKARALIAAKYAPMFEIGGYET